MLQTCECVCVCAHSYSKQGCEQRPVEEVHLQRVGMGGKAAGRDWAVKAIASLAKEKLQGNYRTPNVCIRHYDVYVYTHTKHVYICTHTCIHMCMCMCIYLFECICTCVYTHSPTHTHPVSQLRRQGCGTQGRVEENDSSDRGT